MAICQGPGYVLPSRNRMGDDTPGHKADASKCGVHARSKPAGLMYLALQSVQQEERSIAMLAQHGAHSAMSGQSTAEFAGVVGASDHVDALHDGGDFDGADGSRFDSMRKRANKTCNRLLDRKSALSMRLKFHWKAKDAAVSDAKKSNKTAINTHNQHSHGHPSSVRQTSNAREDDAIIGASSWSSGGVYSATAQRTNGGSAHGMVDSDAACAAAANISLHNQHTYSHAPSVRQAINVREEDAINGASSCGGAGGQDSATAQRTHSSSVQHMVEGDAEWAGGAVSSFPAGCRADGGRCDLETSLTCEMSPAAYAGTNESRMAAHGGQSAPTSTNASPN